MRGGARAYDSYDFRRRPSIALGGAPQGRLSHVALCTCGDRQRDHEKLFGRCWVCGTGRGDGCQRFTKA